MNKYDCVLFTTGEFNTELLGPQDLSSGHSCTAKADTTPRRGLRSVFEIQMQTVRKTDFGDLFMILKGQTMGLS